MTVRVWQLTGEAATVDINDPADDQDWWADGSESLGDIYSALESTLPTTYRGLWLQNYRPDHLGAGFWRVRVHYGKIRPLLPVEAKFSADTTGGTIHRETSFGTDPYAVKTVDGTLVQDSSAAPDYNNLIGVTQDGVSGVDVVSPKFAFTITRKFYAGALPPSFIQYLFSATGSVNSDAFTVLWRNQILTFQPGECLFNGAAISDEGQDINGGALIGVAYKFEGSPNRADIYVGDIGPITKFGWQYLWVRYETRSDGTALTKFPQAVYVEDVYPESVFGLLGTSQ